MITRLLCLSVFLLMACSVAAGGERVYKGSWKTTNRRLDGTMTCVIKPLSEDKWTAHFKGIWQGVPFDYTVQFWGPDDALRCAARVDGAAYSCRDPLRLSNSRPLLAANDTWARLT